MVGPGFVILPNEVALLASYICFSFVLPDHFCLSTFDTGERRTWINRIHRIGFVYVAIVDLREAKRERVVHSFLILRL